MLGLKKILLPVDFSDRSAGAARYAQALGRHFRSEIIVLHAEPNLALLSGVGVGVAVLTSADLESQLRARLESFLVDEFNDLSVKRVLVSGDPATKIVEYAHAENVDLVVMPTYGHGPFRLSLLGSVVAKVLHDCDCPIWTGTHLEEAPPQQ